MTSSLVPKVPPDSTHISGYDICSDNNDIVDINSTTNIFDTSNILPTTSILVPKGSYNFVCECCDFKCSRQSQYDRHLSTRKHKDTYNGYKIDIISTKKFQKVPRVYVYVVLRINIAKAYIITKRSVRSFKRTLKKIQRKIQRKTTFP